jgi:hypothetical protein
VLSFGAACSDGGSGSATGGAADTAGASSGGAGGASGDGSGGAATGGGAGTSAGGAAGSAIGGAGGGAGDAGSVCTDGSSAPLPPWRPSSDNTVSQVPTINTLQAAVKPLADSRPWYNIYGFSGHTFNRHYGKYGGFMLHGGGHSSTDDNMVVALDLDVEPAVWKKIHQSTVPYQRAHQEGFDSVNGEYGDGSGGVTYQPATSHTYSTTTVLPPSAGAPCGSLIRPGGYTMTYDGGAYTDRAHWLRITDTSATNLMFERASVGDPRWRNAYAHDGVHSGGGDGFGSAAMAAYHAGLKRLYWMTGLSTAGRNFMRYLDLDPNSPSYRQQIKTSTFSSVPVLFGVDINNMRYNPVHQILIRIGYSYVDSNSPFGDLKCEFYDPAQHSLGWQKAPISGDIPAYVDKDIAGAKQQAIAYDYCPENDKWYLLVRETPTFAAIYEVTIPANPTQTWTFVKVPTPAGPSLPPTFLPHEQWSWSPAARCFMYHGGGNDSDANFDVYAYRPPGV